MPSGIRRILCPVDFSSPSTRAHRYARAVASWYGAEVVLLHVHQLAVKVLTNAPFAGPESFEPASLSGRDRQHLEDSLRSLARDDPALGAEDIWVLDESSNVPQAILRNAKALECDCLVIGTHGRSGFRRLVLGSVTEQVLQTAPCAVLTVPPSAAETPPVPLCTRIVCPIDFSDASLNALDCAVTIAKRAKARLSVSHIVELPPEIPDSPALNLSRYREDRFAHASAAMAEALAPYRSEPMVDELVLAGRAGPEILRLASEQQADLIVMGVQGRGSVDMLLFGSVTQHVLRQTTCPLLTIPPGHLTR
ncbi:MAG: universal stress protein [Acidobacteriota bacterium]